MLLSKVGRAYRRRVIGLAYELPDRWRLPLKGKLAMDLVMHVPDRRVRDCDNILKGLFDSMQHSGIIENDGNIDEIHLVRGSVKPGGCVDIMIRVL